jgi:putative acetyltransferase
MIAIRPVEGDADFRTLRSLFIEYEAALPAHLRHGSVPELNELMATYREKNRAFLARFEGAAVGCVAVRELDDDTALLLRLYVIPTRRGLGAARALVEKVLEFARAGAYHRVVLDTNKVALEPAYRLYRSMGFVDCGPFMTVT